MKRLLSQCRGARLACFGAPGLFIVVLAACMAPSPPTPAPSAASTVAAQVTAAPLAPATACAGSFVTHKLPFATGTRLREIGTYISNGAGVAATDLDGDGDLDLVFASIDRESAILWNRGDLAFEAEILDDSYTRGVAVVDVDGDGLLDITFTHRGLEGVSYWRNQGDGAGPRFARERLPGVNGYAYAMAWGDLDADGRLELVTGSYAAELKQHGIDDPAQNPRAGVAIYQHQGDRWNRQRLDPEAEALSIGIVDLNGDHRPEIWVANDFAVKDAIWQRNGKEWAIVEPFDQTAHSTMSTEWGVIASDGGLALFSTDMNPYDIAPGTLAKWLPMMAQMNEHRFPDDPQIMANVLQMRDSRGAWRNEALSRGVEATGWSWAGRFGDLDQDGALDLYIVNGMIAADMFAHLPNAELVEENQAFRNRGDGAFARMPGWGLASTASGRGMVMGDMDGDGDLDIVVNNLRGFAQLFENQLCGGNSLRVDLRWKGMPNRYAIGTQLALHTSAGILHRDIRASGGYLSGDPAEAHFGFLNGTALKKLEITWPDGAVSTINQLDQNVRLTVTR